MARHLQKDSSARSHFLSPRVPQVFIRVFLILLLACAPAPALGDEPSIPLPTTMDYSREASCSESMEREAVRLINDSRRDNGLPPLRGDLQLEWAAREHSLRMASDREMSHQNWLKTLRLSGFPGRYRAQNVAWNQESAEEVVRDWLESTEHRRNILNPYFRFTAVGCVRTRDGEIWWTEYLGG